MEQTRERQVMARGARCRTPTSLERLGRRLRRPLARSPMRARLRAIYRAALWLSTAGRGLRASLPGGETIRVLPGYDHMTWNLDEYSGFKRAIRPGGVALDIGANVGCYASLLGQWVGPAGRVFAFEPAPGAFLGLHRHIALNGLGAIVVPIQAAVSDREGTSGFLASGGPGTDRLATADEERSVPDLPRVRTLTIDRFCTLEKIRPDFIKVDVEGFELAVLRGARRTIQATCGHLALFVEMHPRLWPQLGCTQDALLEELEGQGLVAEPLRSSADVWFTEGLAVRLRPK